MSHDFNRLEYQLAYFDANAELAYERALQAFADDRPAVIAAARERLIAGYPVYGTTGWEWPAEKLRDNRREECADAINYTLMEMGGGS
jgi:hypothetical protein